MLEKIFSWSKKKEEEVVDAQSGVPVIRFGRYSDNNKPIAKVEKWNEAENLFKEKKYTDSILAFFDYLRDEEQDNVRIVKEAEKNRLFILPGVKDHSRLL